MSTVHEIDPVKQAVMWADDVATSGRPVSDWHQMLAQGIRRLAAKRDFFSPDGEDAVALIARLMTRNEANRLKQQADRLQFQRNVSNLATHPTLHLGFCVQLMEKYAQAGSPATFEIGLVMGAAIAFATCSRSSEKVVKQMLADIAAQQDNQQQGEMNGNGPQEEGKEEAQDQGAPQREAAQAQPPLHGEDGRPQQGNGEP